MTKEQDRGIKNSDVTDKCAAAGSSLNVAVIVSGGSVNGDFVQRQIEKIRPRFLIGADAGLDFFYERNLTPTHAVGDFDSVCREASEFFGENENVAFFRYPPEKDETDTELAMRLAVKLKPDGIYLMGATGTRLDHALANIGSLKTACDAGIKAALLDETNRVSLIKSGTRIEKSDFYGGYFSIFPLGSALENLTIKGAKYPLSGYTLKPLCGRCVSNEPLDETVEITFDGEYAILTESRE